MELETLHEIIDHLIEADPADFADAESIEVLQRQLTRLECFVTEATAAFDAAGNWAPDGARNAASWLATRCALPQGAARARVRLARSVRHLPAFTGAWREGAIGAEHVRAVARLRRDITEKALERDEEILLTQAKTLRFEPFTRALAYWEQLADPDGTEESEQERKNRRDVYLEASLNGMWLGQMTLDPISGAIVSRELRRLEAEMFKRDWAEAKERLGREPGVDELARTSAQRRADALVEMATRSGIAPADGIRPAPLFSILVGYETLHGRICQLSEGSVLSPGALLPWMDAAYFERAIFVPGRRIEVSIRARLFTGATRRAIELRDQQCTHKYCGEPAEHSQIDHIQPYSTGGETTQENGRVLCKFHNLLRNQELGRPPPAA
jgi:Domain of unknown function (DUF222)/HNH endonuclease